MYELVACGETVNAAFRITDSGNVDRISMEVMNEELGSDCYNVSILDAESRSKLRDVWMVLRGKPWQIAEIMDTKYPMAKMESGAIFSYLDTVPADANVTITYPIEAPNSKVIRESMIHRAMRASQRKVIAAIYGLHDEEIEVLEVNG